MKTHNKQSSILSLIKKTPLFVVAMLFVFQSCIQKPGPANLSGIDPRNPSSPPTPEIPTSPPAVIYGIEILNDQLVINGNFLEGVQNVRLEGPMGQVENFQIESKTNSEIFANGLRNFSLLVGAVFSVIITDAHAASTYQIQFTLENGSVTAQKLAQMGAATGQVLKWNGTTWAPSDLGGLTYAGIWNADNNAPNITSGGNQGEFYIVGTSGFRDPNGGPDLAQEWNIGDWVIWNDDQNEWDRISSSSTVASFNGRTGPVMPQYGDYVWADIDKTGSSLNDLFDVNSVGATAGQVLMWNGAAWAPGNVDAGDGGGGGGVNSVTATAPLFSTGGANPNLVITQAGSASAGFLSAADWNTFNNKENALPTGSVAQFYRGNKTLGNFADTVRASALTGLAPSAGTVVATDTLIQGFNKLTGNIISVESVLATKEDALPTDGDATKFLRGDKTWQVINTDNIAIGDNLFFDEALVMASALTGYTIGTNTAINATDDLLGALGKLQGQINDLSIGAGNFQADGSTPMTGNLQLQNNQIVFGTGPNTISLKGSEDASEPLLFTLPGTYGVPGRALGTDGTGQLTWLAISGESGDPGVVELFGDVNGIVPNIFINAASITTAKIANSNVTTEKIADNAITNAKIAAGANIAQSKIENLTTDLTTINSNISTISTDLSTLTTQVSTLPTETFDITTVVAAGDLSGNYPNPTIADGVITNAKIAAGANIAQSKIANLTTDLTAINTSLSTLSTQVSDLADPGNRFFEETLVLATELTGYALGTNTAINASDTVLSAFGKLQRQINDLPVGGGSEPAGPAGGELAGTYPNPTIAVGAITNDKIAAGANIAQSKIENLTTDLAAIDTRIDDLNTDQITELGGAANKFFSETLVFASQLTDYTLGTNTAITTGDTVLSAFGKLQRQINDLPVGGGSEPAGPAGGELAGTYPNPTIAVGAITNDKIAAGANIAQSKIENLTTDLTAIDTRIDDLNTDQITQLGGATNRFFNETLVLATELSGYTLGANASIAATDTLLEALGKIQRQINDMPAGGGTGDGDFLADGSIPMTGNLVMQNHRVVFGTGANTTAIRGAATTTTPLEFTLPGNYGTAGYALGTDGTGGLVWVEVTGGGGEIGEGAASGDLTGNYPGPFIRADAITTTKIINEAVTNEKLAPNAVTADKILNNTINNAKIAADAEIEQSKIQGLVTALSTLDTRIGTVETDLEDIDLSGISTDDIAAGVNPNRQYFSETLVFASTLAGLNAGANAAIANGDTLKVALEKLQAQISAAPSGGEPTGTASGHLTGTYPAPEIATGVITNAMISASAAIEQTKILNLSTNLTTLTDNIAAANTRIDELDADDIAPTATRQYFTQAAVRSTPLDGFSTASGTAVVASDTLITALGKLQQQINTLDSGGGGSGDFLANGTIPMTGALNMNNNAINNAGTIITSGVNSVSTQNLSLRGSTSGTVNLRANASSANYTLSFPAVPGTSGQVLTSDGSTGLTWSTPGEIDPEDLVIPDNSITDNMVATGISAGKIKRDIASINDIVVLSNTDHGIVILSNSDGDVVLPDPTVVGAGFEVTITNLKEAEDTPNNTIVYSHQPSTTINGSETISLDTKYATVTLITDGSQWYIMRQTGTVAGGDAGGGPPVGPGTGGACPADENYVQIPGNAQLGVSTFCVMKYHAKQSGAQAVTGPAGLPWTTISQMDAKAACQANGAGYDLISNPEWMTIARNIEAQGINWSGGSRGVGKLIKGYTTGIEAGPALEVTNENEPWNGTGVNPATNTLLNNYLQRRTFHLSNGQVLWDFSGNVITWVDWTLGGTLGEPPVTCNGIDFSQAPGSGLPLNEEDSLSSNSEFSSIDCSEFSNNDFRPEILSYSHAVNGIGAFKSWDAGLTGVVRGGAYYSNEFDAGSGIYSISIIPRSFAELEPEEIGDPPEEELPFIGFRCVYRP